MGPSRIVGEKMKQLILGTVQLGMNYGINNKNGKPPVEEAFNILNTAYEKRISILDTASAYGDSEKIIGNFIESQNKHFKIITKLRKLDKDKDQLKQIEESLKHSLLNLSVSKVEYYLYHSFEDLVNNKNAFEYLNELRKKGVVEKLGVSIYDTEELEHILSNYSEDIKFIQLPFNIFDLRWLKNDLLKRAKEKNIEIAARSVFLQGLLFTDKNTASRIHDKAYDYIAELKEFSNNKGFTVEQVAMGFVKQQEHIDYLLIGCENEEQLLKNSEIFNMNIEFSEKDLELINKKFGTIEKKIIDPRQW